jgi:hypothetical protein
MPVATHLFCPKQINASEPQRSEIAAQIVSVIACRSATGDKFFSVSDVLKRASLSNMMGSVFGKNYETVELLNGKVVKWPPQLPNSYILAPSIS